MWLPPEVARDWLGLLGSTPRGEGGRAWVSEASRQRGSSCEIFVYDIRMREDEVSEQQIREWVAEAETGYDVDELKRRGRGRPGRGAEPMQVVAVRLTVDEMAALDAVAARDNVSRSEAIRRALAQFSAA